MTRAQRLANPLHHPRTRVAALALAFAAALACAPPAHAAPDPQKILADCDAVRNPSTPFSATISLTEFSEGKQVEASSLLSFSKQRQGGGQFASVVKYLTPARDAGKLMLKNGNDLWFFDPTSKASLRLSPQQRLIGQASNGDVVTVNLSKDYKATLLGEEDLNDGEKKPRHAYKLALAAAAPDVTYSAIEIWVDATNSQPIKARFLAESGQLLKTAYYRHFEQTLGAVRPTETVIIDGLNNRSVTILRLSDFKEREIPDAWLQKDYLPRFDQ